MTDDDKHYMAILERELEEATDYLNYELLHIAIVKDGIQAALNMAEAYDNISKKAAELSVPNCKGVPQYMAEINAASAHVHRCIVESKKLEIARDKNILAIKTKYTIPACERRVKDCEARLVKFRKELEDKANKASETITT